MCACVCVLRGAVVMPHVTVPAGNAEGQGIRDVQACRAALQKGSPAGLGPLGVAFFMLNPVKLELLRCLVKMHRHRLPPEALV